MKLQSHVIQFMTVDQILLSLQIYFAPPCCGALYHGVTHTYIAPGRGRKETRVGFSKNWSIQHAGKQPTRVGEGEERKRLEEYGADNSESGEC